MSEKFNKAWEYHAVSTWKTCLHFTKNHFDAEDLLQMTWEKSYNYWKNKCPSVLTRNYFATIAKNTWIDEIRRKRLTTVPYEDSLHTFASTSEFSSSLDTTYLLNTLVSNLTKKQQVIFLLADVCKCSLKEIALLTKMNVGAVKANLFRARQKVKNEVRENVEAENMLDEEDALRVHLYSNALLNGNVQLIASLLSDSASIPALYVQQQTQSSAECKLAA